MSRTVIIHNLIAVFLVSLFLGGCGNKEYVPSPLGSANKISGRTVVVSIFTNDKSCTWEDSDASIKDDSLKYLSIACEWIEEKVSEYNAEAEFIYDWNKHKDLVYEGYVNARLSDDDIENRVLCCELIDDLVDSSKLCKKYKAENIIYMMYVNTPDSNSVTSSTYCYYKGMEPTYEICNILINVEGEEECPAAFAHEILHTFGAPDLYMEDTSNDNYGITKEYVEELERKKSNDIMYTTFNEETLETYYDRIENDFSDMDAYYVGLIDKCDEVEQRGFLPSQHIVK